MNPGAGFCLFPRNSKNTYSTLFAMTNLRIETVAIDQLQSDPKNLRIHDKANLESLKSSLKRFGQRKPIVVNQQNVILAGNGQFQAAQELGWQEIQIARTPENWSETEELAYAIADNRTSDLSHFDNEALIGALDNFDIKELESVGFSEKDLEDLSKVWAKPKDLEDLFKEVGEPTDDDLFVKVEFKLDPDTYAKWKACLNATGTRDIDAIYMVIHAAHDALIKDE